MVTWQEARRLICQTVAERSRPTTTESVQLENVLGRVLAEEIFADRPYPPFNRSTRDGYAVRCADLPDGKEIAGLRLAGEIPAGRSFGRSLQAGECAAIMTGAPVPEGADAVVMLELAQAENDRVIFSRRPQQGENVVLQGSEAQAGEMLLSPGVRFGYAEIALAAQVGKTPVKVRRPPRVAILSTGDEIVAHDRLPRGFQIRNTNSISLGSLATLAVAHPVALGNVPDNRAALREAVERGLAEDALAISGGVSMGRYDLVEEVLEELGAEIIFESVAVRPGKPAVFGYCRNKPVFGLPGNPISTIVTFEILVAPALDVLAGATPQALMLVGARLLRDGRYNPALAHFLPARILGGKEEPVVEEISWQGSGDLAALARANCFLCVPQGVPEMAAGKWAQVLMRRGAWQ